MKLSDIKEGVAALLKERNYSGRATLKHHEWFCRAVRRFLDERYGNQEYTKDRGAEFIQSKYGFDPMHAPSPLTHYQRFLLRMLDRLDAYLDGRQLAKLHRRRQSSIELEGEFKEALEEYQQFMRNSCYADATRSDRKDFTVKFFHYLRSLGLKSLKGLSDTDCIGFLQRFSGYRPRSISEYACNMRCLLRFLHPKWTAKELASGIVGKKIQRYAAIPSTWTLEEVQSLVAAVDRTTAMGKRNYAIILLASVLGLRAMDISMMTFSNINWRARTLNIVQHKTGQPLSLPLPKQVFDAIVDYVLSGRPGKSRSKRIFVSHTPPFDPFRKTCGLAQILKGPFKKAGIDVTGRRHGLHSLRHTGASLMLAIGTPVPVISGILGHSQIDSTKVYLKTDEERLAECVLDPKELEDG